MVKQKISPRGEILGQKIDLFLGCAADKAQTASFYLGLLLHKIAPKK